MNIGSCCLGSFGLMQEKTGTSATPFYIWPKRKKKKAHDWEEVSMAFASRHPVEFSPVAGVFFSVLKEFFFKASLWEVVRANCLDRRGLSEFLNIARFTMGLKTGLGVYQNRFPISDVG
ncbi:uncharacterized protein TM35_000931020 [Trypanosoma theileri]|uniref:Uncharacterized protein n=1 Tax=Trypanosoma theileri TaxID=67003 RepID=A0A1X0NED4_9TRYP|nr:uncharacterized protein TM35_000931020 [Trypanosoma theileri]ORC82344.1 hypothetical protein TM35_000931020 [Trypanosoma theileri]